ncbi:MAG: oxygenase MpaB family protein [Acidobacteriota bacterium]
MRVVTRDEHEAALAELARDVRDPREGILGPGSVAWRLGGDLAVFLGGGRAALLQLAHPMVAHAVDDHSRARADVVGRFQRTFRLVFAMVFGDLDDAFAAARRVHAIHSRIHGTIPHAIGGWLPGTPYHANDADALRWVHATLIDTVLVVRERLGDPLSVADRDTFVVEQNRFARLFAIPHDLLPRSYADHATYMQRMLGGDRLAVAPCARDMAAFLLGRGAGAQPPLGRVAEALTASMLPRHLAEGFGLARTRVTTAAVHAGLATFAPVYRCVPRELVAIPARSEAVRRLAGRAPSRFDAWMERQLFGLSRQVTGVTAT